MRKAIPWSTRRFFAANSAKMQDITAKRKRIKAMRDQQAPLNTMEALKDAFSAQEPDSNPTEEATTEPSVGCEPNS